MGWWRAMMAGSPGNFFLSDSEENFKCRKPGNVCVLQGGAGHSPFPPPQSAFPQLTLPSFPLQPLWSGRTGHLLTPLLNPSPEPAPSTLLCYHSPLSFTPSAPLPFLSNPCLPVPPQFLPQWIPQTNTTW